MAVVMPSSPPAMDFDRPPPFLSAPSSPSRYADVCFSAPASPTRMAEFYRDLHDEFDGISLGAMRKPSSIPFGWEETPGTPKSPKSPVSPRFEDDFAFDFHGNSEEPSITAEELFDGGKIRPLKPPPRMQFFGQIPSPRSPRSPRSQGKKLIKGAFSPKQRKDSDLMNDFDPFAAAVENTRNRVELERGRGRESALMASSRTSRRTTRSLSPFRIPELATPTGPSTGPGSGPEPNQTLHNASKSSTSSSSSSSSSKAFRKWRLKDFLLFRSASEGDKDSLKYKALLRKHHDEVKNTNNGSSFRSGTPRSGSSGNGSKRKGQVSAHELHYTANRAVSEDMKKKTFLPYKKNLFGFGHFARK